MIDMIMVMANCAMIILLNKLIALTWFITMIIFIMIDMIMLLLGRATYQRPC